MHPNKDYDHRRLRDVPIVTPAKFSMIDYMDRSPIFFNVVRFRHMQTDGNESKVLNFWASIATQQSFFKWTVEINVAVMVPLTVF